MMKLRPIVVDGEGVVLGGNMRLKALQHMKYKEIPDEWVKRADELTEDEKKRFIIEDNVGFGDWDFDALANEWDTELLDDWGLDLPVDFAGTPEAHEDDYEIPDEIETDIVRGDLFEIGDHRLMCGDSTKSDDVVKLMDGNRCTITFTSPPYNAGDNSLGGNKKMKSSKYLSSDDNMSEDEYLNLLILSTQNSIKISDVVCYNHQILAGNKFVVPQWINHFRYKLIDRAIWNKGGGQPAAADRVLNSRFEDLYFFSGINDKPKRSFPNALFHGTESNIYDGRGNSGENKESGSHAATMPIHLPNWILSVIDANGNSVYDPFLGSGTTMVAAHQLNRRCYGMEIDPKYCQVIIDRMLKIDPTITIIKNGEPYNGTSESQNRLGASR